MDWNHEHRRLCISSEACPTVCPAGHDAPDAHYVHDRPASLTCVNEPQMLMPLLAGLMATKPALQRSYVVIPFGA